MKRRFALIILLTTSWFSGCGPKATTPEPKANLPLSLKVGVPIGQVRAVADSLWGPEVDNDGPDRTQSDTNMFRSVYYGLVETNSVVAVNVIYRYRKADGLVWSVIIDPQSVGYTNYMGEIPISANRSTILKILGNPIEEKSYAPVIDELAWQRGKVGYRIQVYNQDYSSFTARHRKGQVDRLEMFSLELAPPPAKRDD
jgi:hypothetical protein